jgi:hypothetical protein
VGSGGRHGRGLWEDRIREDGSLVSPSLFRVIPGAISLVPLGMAPVCGLLLETCWFSQLIGDFEGVACMGVASPGSRSFFIRPVRS